jgi:23S rRNA pseudouridine1911/1915/1917 synthase
MSSFAELLDILYEDNHLIAINKPCGWPTTHFDGSEETVDRLVKSYIKEKHHKPGNVFLGVVQRLDKPTSGALVFTRTSKAASRMSEQFRDGEVEKVYWAIIEAPASARPKILNQPWGTLEDWLWHDDADQRVKVVPSGTPEAKLARTHFQIKATHEDRMLLELRPQTGRKHQLRVQLASRGVPIYGDAKYGATQRFGPGIGLHARSLAFLHPTKTEPISLTAELPQAWRGRFAHLLK